MRQVERDKYERLEIRTVADKPIWTLVKKFVNSLEENQVFNRLELFNGVYIRGVAEEMISRETAVDHYRKALCLTGIIEHVGFGLYAKRKDVPISLTITKLKRVAYKETWKSWFMPPDEW